MKLLQSVTVSAFLATSVAATAQITQQSPSSVNPPTTGTRIYNMGNAPAKSTNTTETKQHYLSIQLFSIIPEKGIESFQGTPAPGAMITGIGGMSGPAYSDESNTRFSVQVSPMMKQGRYGAAVKVVPWTDPEGLISAQSFEVDLSDMKTTSIELARNSEGRLYLLSLMPAVEVQTEEPPKSVSSIAKELAAFGFERSAMVLNDEEFLGTMTGSGGEKAFLDIPGKFKVEFALVPFRDARISGKLENGVLNINNGEGDSITVYNVLSQLAGTLPGGPYEVWARWSAPSQSAEEAIARNLAFLEKQRAEGVAAFMGPEFDEAIRKLKAGKPNITHGLGGIPSIDRVGGHQE